MKIKKITYRLLGAVCAFAAIACVDDSVDLDNVSTEVTLGSGTTTLPLGFMEKKTIKDLLDEQNIEGLEKDENGNLSFKYSGEGDSFSIDGVQTDFEIPEVRNTFSVEYPQFDFEMKQVGIDEESDLTVNLGALEQYKNLPDIPGFDLSNYDYFIPEGVLLPTVKGTFYKEFRGDDMHLEIDVPEQIDNVTKVIFRDVDGQHHGAPMRLRVAFNDLAGINGGGELTFNLGLSGGKFRILDSENNLVCDGNEYSEKYIIEPDSEYLEFVIYVESLTNTTPLNSEHKLDIPVVLTYDMEFDVKAKSGAFSLNKMPHIELYADFEYGDAEIAVNTDVPLFEYSAEDTDPIEVTGLPSAIKTINRLNIAQNEHSNLRFFANGLEWLGEHADDIEIVAKLPEFLTLQGVSGQGYVFDEASHELRATVANLSKGIDIRVVALDFGNEGLAPDADGNIELTIAPDVIVRYTDETVLKVSSLIHEGDLEISTGIEKALLSIESVSGRVDYTYDINQEFALTGLENLKLKIDGVGIKPIIEVRVTNPLTIPAQLKGSVTPSANGVANENNKVSFSNVQIAAAKYAGGAITPAEMIIVIADESLRNNYTDAKYTFVACDVTKLLLGTLPDAFKINIELTVDSSEVQTLYVTDEYTVTYDYKVDVPIAVDGTFDITYNQDITGLQSTFESIADYDLKVGDIAVIATIANTTPLELGAQLVLKDANGDETDVQIIIDADNIILGSPDGVTPKESVVRLALDLGHDGRVANVANIDGMSLILRATSAADNVSVPLNEKQYIGAKLQLEIAGGVTVDINNLYN